MKSININKLEDYALNSANIKQVLGGNIKIIEYSELSKYNSIDEAFDNEGRFILFFATESSTVGHWESCFKIDNNIIFFDSYGLAVDECKEYVQKKLMINLREYPDYLTDLLKKSNYNLYHNTTKYQQMKGDISTCGKHSSNRLLNKNLNGLEYKNSMNQMKSNYKAKTYDGAISLFFLDKYKIQ